MLHKLYVKSKQRIQIINYKDNTRINLSSIKYIEFSVYQNLEMKMTWAYKLSRRQ